MKVLIFFLLFQIPDQIKVDTVSECWNYFANFATFGGEFSSGYYGLSWPGKINVNNYYIWGSYFVVGTKIGSEYFCTASQYPPYYGEWEPSDTIYEINARADHEMVTFWDDYKSNPRNSAGRHLGVKVKVISLSFTDEPFNDFIAYELYISYDSSQCDIQEKSDFLDSVYVGFIYDFDISGADPTDPSTDDLYSFDGWTFGEWDSLGYPYDSITLLPDSFLSVPDGVWDQFLVWGDESDEFTVHGDTYEIPRNIGYMYDNDGENGVCEGYAGVKLIYAPKSPSDSIWIDNYGDTVRWVCPAAFQVWKLGSEPGIDADYYAYLKGRHPATAPYRFVPPPDFGAGWDYKILVSSGPFKIYHGDTICIVFGVVIGQRMNGGYDSYWGRGWIRGLRQDADFMLKAYYSGSMSSDPIHPSCPKGDYHWIGIRESYRDREIKLRNFQIFYTEKGIYIVSKKMTTISIFDISGRKLMALNLYPEKKVKIGKLKRGVYFIKDINNRQIKIVVP